MPEMLIGGEWRQAAAHEELEVVNPATEETVATVPAGKPEDVELAVATAKRAFAEWSKTDVEKRAAILAKAAELIEANAKELAATLTSEQGKPIAEARGSSAVKNKASWKSRAVTRAEPAITANNAAPTAMPKPLANCWATPPTLVLLLSSGGGTSA